MSETYDEKEVLQKLIEIANNMDQYPELSATSKDADNWSNFWDMCKDIRTHIKNSGGEIECHDFPMQLKIGYIHKNTGKVWKIRLTDLTKSLNEYKDQTKSDFVRKALQTKEGKEALAKSFNT